MGNLFKGKNNSIVVEHSFIRNFSSKLNGKRNTICLNRIWGNQIKIHCDGENNKVYLSGEIRNCKFEIHGNNNVVDLRSVKYQQTHIIVRGRDSQITVGEKSTCGGARFVLMGENNKICIGSDCQFADNIEVWATDSHPLFSDGNIVNPNKPICIGQHVWLGAYAKVLKGVEIEDGAVIGMGAIVTKSIKARTLNIGSPSRIVRENIKWSRNFLIE